MTRDEGEITQFDIGGDITARNIELAEYLMSVYQPYEKVSHQSAV